jgi:hypothetical protein
MGYKLAIQVVEFKYLEISADQVRNAFSEESSRHIKVKISLIEQEKHN